jgi:hypothetical protein
MLKTWTQPPIGDIPWLAIQRLQAPPRQECPHDSASIHFVGLRRSLASALLDVYCRNSR